MFIQKWNKMPTEIEQTQDSLFNITVILWLSSNYQILRNPLQLQGKALCHKCFNSYSKRPHNFAICNPIGFTSAQFWADRNGPLLSQDRSMHNQANKKEVSIRMEYHCISVCILSNSLQPSTHLGQVQIYRLEGWTMMVTGTLNLWIDPLLQSSNSALQSKTILFMQGSRACYNSIIPDFIFSVWFSMH